MPYQQLKKTHKDIHNLLLKELQRQQENLEMIPSENFVSMSVLEALGSVATNKYSEGYPGKRYYGGNMYIDEIEKLAIERAKQLFHAEHVNVQPLSGAPANLAIYTALLEVGDTVLGMDLSHGGHLTHGHPVTLPAKIYNFIRYKTNPDTGLLDYDEIEKLTHEHKPKMILVGFSSYSRDIDYQKIKKIAESVGALTMADIAHIAGLIATGHLNNPVEIFDVISTTTHKTLRGPRGGMIMCKSEHAEKIDKAVFPHLQGGPHENVITAKAVAFKEALSPEFKNYSEQILKNAKALEKVFKERGFAICFHQTDNHLLLLDLRSKNIDGHTAQEILDKSGITVNKNVIPDDPASPMRPSGIRLGTPALTTRGMKDTEMEQIANWIADILENPEDESLHTKINQEIKSLTSHFPLYSELF